MLFGQCPNRGGDKLKGASLTAIVGHSSIVTTLEFIIIMLIVIVFNSCRQADISDISGKNIEGDFGRFCEMASRDATKRN